MQNLALKKFIPGIAWFFITLYMMCLPGSDIPDVGWLNSIFFDKWVHVGAFALLMFLFSWPFYRSGLSSQQRKNYLIKIALSLSLWGLTIEFIQKTFIPGRSFDVFDWIADTAGVLITFWFCKKFITSDKSDK